MDQYEILFPSVGIVGAVYLADLPNFNSEMRNIQLMAEDLAAQLISEDDDNKGGLSGDVPPPAFHTQFIQYINKQQESSGGESKYEFIFTQLSVDWSNLHPLGLSNICIHCILASLEMGLSFPSI